VTGPAWRPRILGPLIAIIGLTSLAPTSAQALPNWMIPVTEDIGAGSTVEVEAKVEKALSLLTTIGTETPVQISCEKLTLDKGLLEGEGKSSATLLLSACTTLLNGKTDTKCKPAEPIAAKVKDLLVLHEGVAYDRFEPAEAGKPFTTLVFGEECLVGEKVPITGTFYAKDSNGKLEVAEKTHVFEEGPLTKLSFGIRAATIDGSASASLAGVHAGELWRGLGA
jgi:hypothetical protein